MTPSDLRELARYWDYKETFFNISVPTFQNLVLANPQRWSITFCIAALTGSAYVTTASTSTNTQGFAFPSGSSSMFLPLSLDYWDHGALVQQSWNMNLTGTGLKFTVFETILQDR